MAIIDAKLRAAAPSWVAQEPTAEAWSVAADEAEERGAAKRAAIMRRAVAVLDERSGERRLWCAVWVVPQSCGGLGVHRGGKDGKKWMIVHCATGCALRSPISTKRSALAAAREFLTALEARNGAAWVAKWLAECDPKRAGKTGQRGGVRPLSPIFDALNAWE